MRADPRTPILIGVSQITDTQTPFESARSPMDLAEEASRLAVRDAGLPESQLANLDSIAILRSFSDTTHRFPCPFGRAKNPPVGLARRLGSNPREAVYAYAGGNMPQWLVNRNAELIAGGERDLALICGSEALRTWPAAQRAGYQLDYNEGLDDPDPHQLGVNRVGWSEHEDTHGMNAAIMMYPLFENSIRAHRRRSIDQHSLEMGALLERFAAVAKDNPYATRRQGYSAADISTTTKSNRMIWFPYPKLMNANPYVDQAAALLMSSVAKARELGVPEHRWVYLHGCADANDHWTLSERENYHSCPAIRVGASKALDMANRTLDDISFFDLYSCFPSAVEVGCQEIGLTEDDPRSLTVTGGLPYFGGPGNNYVTHSIAALAAKLRAKPGKFGMVTANGNYLTKHSFGIYSTTPTQGSWKREDPSSYQRELDDRPKPAFTETPSGAATIETYTVFNNRSGPEKGIVIDRLTSTGERFISNVADTDVRALGELQATEGVGRSGSVTQSEGRNIWSFQELE